MRPRRANTRHHRRLVVRTALQIVAALFVLSMVLARSAPIGGVSAPSWWPNLQGICPIAMSQTAAGLLTGTAPPADRSDLWMLIGALLAAGIAGSLFCGWLCPLGSVQEWVGRLGRRIFGRRYNRLVLGKVDRALSFLRYAVLALLVVQTVRFGEALGATLNPARALMHVWTGGAFVAGLAVLVAVLVGSLLVERPWCRWLCPFGALQGVIARLSPWTIRRNASACISCGKCARVCPFSIPVDQASLVRDGRCNRCTHCVAACPVDDVLDFTSGLPGGGPP
ncbi:MAG: 4Fe-4S binding protein, partial [Spirochaetaceae bacterium]